MANLFIFKVIFLTVGLLSATKGGDQQEELANEPWGSAKVWNLLTGQYERLYLKPDCACPASAIGAYESEVSSNGDACTLGNTVTVRCKDGAVSTTGGTTVFKTCGEKGWEATSDLGCWSVESECTSARVREMTGRSNDNKGYLYDSCCIYPSENDVNLWDYNGQGGNADALTYCAGSASGYTGSVAVPDDVADWRVYKNIADNDFAHFPNAAAPFLHQPVTNAIPLADGVCSAFSANSSS